MLAEKIIGVWELARNRSASPRPTRPKQRHVDSFNSAHANAGAEGRQPPHLEAYHFDASQVVGKSKRFWRNGWYFTSCFLLREKGYVLKLRMLQCPRWNNLTFCNH